MDIANRRKYPTVEPLIDSLPPEPNPAVERRAFSLRIRLTNRGPIRARDYLVQVKIPGEIQVQAIGVKRNRDERISGRGYAVFEYPAQAGSVLYPGYEIQMLPGLTYFVDRDLFQRMRSEDLELIWKTFADDMPPGEGRVYFSEITRW